MAIAFLEQPTEAPPSPWESERDLRVADAAAFLDEHKPGWYRNVNTRKLDMSSIYNCVLAQVFGKRRFFFSQPGFGRGLDFIEERGFRNIDVFCSDVDRERWVVEIEKRRN